MLKKHTGNAIPSIKYQAEIEDYLNIYQHTPLEWPVRKAWLEYLKKNNKKAALYS